MISASEAFEVTGGFAPPFDESAIQEALLASGVSPEAVARFMTAPGEPSVSGPVAEYTRQWFVTSEDSNAARIRMEAEATAYALELRRSGLNWVRLDWIKF